MAMKNIAILTSSRLNLDQFRFYNSFLVFLFVYTKTSRSTAESDEVLTCESHYKHRNVLG